MGDWVNKRILILGMTYPAYSTKYVENVCTGGLEEGTFRMVRIHPVPLRYLEEGKRFKAFQWVRLRARKHPTDPRPESLQIDDQSIQPGEVIPANRPDERRTCIEKSPHCVKSVEQLHEDWKARQVSLGIIRPKDVRDVRIVPRPLKDRKEWLQKEKMLLGQGQLWDRPPKKLDWPEASFNVQWTCDDVRCQTHEMGVAQWGLHELYRKLRNDPERNNKTKAAMAKQLDMTKRDVFMFLGNYRGTQCNFGLMDTYSAARSASDAQGTLF